jgi:putative IMPACT (imprinted ancient) family translation regulator
MLFDDSYKTIVAPVEGFFRDRGSKFLAYAYPIQNEVDTKMYLTELREIHPKAVHHCYAYRLGLTALIIAPTMMASPQDRQENRF